MILDNDKIISHDWKIGEVKANNNDLSDQILSENSKIWNGKIGLLSVSEYLRANTNTKECGSYELNNANVATCKLTNWIGLAETFIWFVSPPKGELYSSYALSFNSVIDLGPTFRDDVYLRPMAYLTPKITLSGSGTEHDPFKLS